MQGGVEVYGKLNKRLDRQITTDAGCKTTAATVHDVGTGDSVVQARWVVHGCDMQVSSTSTPVLQPIADFDHGAIRKQHQQPHAATVSLLSESRCHSSLKSASYVVDDSAGGLGRIRDLCNVLRGVMPHRCY